MDSNPERRRLGLETMASVYGWGELADGGGDFFGYTAEHLFGDIWNREGLSFRDRRLLLIGLLVGRGLHDVVGLQVEAALANGELDEHALREIVILLTHYAGWPDGAKLNSQVEELIARAAKKAAKQALAAEEAVEEP
ncbi:MAG: carboxymuconolactone decarboxylase family protein [Actinomycetota bacterium]